MTSTAKLGNAEFRKQIDAATKGIIEASDDLMNVAKTAKANQAALMEDALKLSAKYGVLEDVVALRQAFNNIETGNAGIEHLQKTLEAPLAKLAAKLEQKDHPLNAYFEAAKPEISKAIEAKDHTAIGKTIQKIVGENGLPKGPVRDLIVQLQQPIEQATEHGVKLTQLIQNEGELSPAKKHILKNIAKAHLPKIKESVTSLGDLGLLNAKEAREQLAQLEQKMGQTITDHAATAAPAAATAAGAKTAPASEPPLWGIGSGKHPANQPSTTVSSIESKGREWYQFLTHDELGKFSGKRAAIAGGAAALLAGGTYMLNRNKEDSWQYRTRSDKSAEAGR